MSLAIRFRQQNHAFSPEKVRKTAQKDWRHEQIRIFQEQLDDFENDTLISRESIQSLEEQIEELEVELVFVERGLMHKM